MTTKQEARVTAASQIPLPSDEDLLDFTGGMDVDSFNDDELAKADDDN